MTSPQGSDALPGLREKIARANHHLDHFDLELDGFVDAHSVPGVVKCTKDGPWDVVVVYPPFAALLPPLLSILCGEVIYHLRSILDHLVWQLVLSNNNNPGIWNAFPICLKPKWFHKTVTRLEHRGDPHPLHGLDPNGQPWAIIESAQPYNSGGDPRRDQLSTLKVLSNIDKHHAIYLQMLFPDRDIELVEWNPDAILLDRRDTPHEPLSFEHETELFRLHFDPDGPEPDVRVKDDLPVSPTFGDDDFQASIGMLTKMRDRVMGLIDDLSPFI